MDMLPGLHTDRDLIIYHDNIEIDLNIYDEDKIKTVIEIINNNLELYINDCEIELLPITKKETNKELCKSIIEMNKKNIKDLLEPTLAKSIQFQKLFTRICLEQYNLSMQLTSREGASIQQCIDYNIGNLKSVLDKLKNLSKFEIISESNKNEMVIFGANGAGKSSFIGFLKKVYYDDMVIIPAQKLLIYNSNSNNYSKNENDINQFQHTNFIEQFKYSYCNIEYFSSMFSSLISAIVNITEYEQNEFFEKKKLRKNLEELSIKETLLERINKIFSKIIPNIEFKLNTKEHCIYPVRFEQEYNINSMSEGEKVILYYIGNVILASPHSYIVIDEPETYLNPSIYSKLWSTLKEVRNDCQFIYISHDINFIKTRKNIDLIWMKSYQHPDIWDFTSISDNIELPKDLLIEVLGCNNKILFCEGDYDGYDYEIYDALFSSSYNVIPVGGCEQVCKYTKAYNACKSIHGNDAIGIIDNDGRTEDEIKKLRNDKIYVTKFNEIEMLLCDEEIIDSILEAYPKKKQEELKSRFITSFFEKVKNDKEKIAMNFVIQKINWMLENYRISSKNIDDIEKELEDLKHKIDVKKELNDYKITIDDIIKKLDYERLLKICNLKKEITSGIGDKIFKDYERKAVGVIKTKLADRIKKKYFSEIEKA